jgi:hypothetical protein
MSSVTFLGTLPLVLPLHGWPGTRYSRKLNLGTGRRWDGATMGRDGRWGGAEDGAGGAWRTRGQPTEGGTRGGGGQGRGAIVSKQEGR